MDADKAAQHQVFTKKLEDVRREGDPALMTDAAVTATDLASDALKAGDHALAHARYADALEMADRAQTPKAHSAGAIAAWQLGLAQPDENPAPNTYWPRAVQHALMADHMVAFKAGCRAASLEAMRLEDHAPTEALAFWRRAIDLSMRLPEDERTLISSAARFAGQILYRQGDREGANAMVDIAIDTAEHDETPGQRLWAAGAAFGRGQGEDDDLAGVWFAKAFALAQGSEGGDALGLAAAALHRHTCVSSALDEKERIRRFETAADLGEKSGTPQGLQWASMALIQIVFAKPAGDESLADLGRLERAVVLGRRSATPQALEQVAGVEQDMASRHRRAGRTEEAVAGYQRAVEAAQQSGLPRALMVECWTHIDLARIAIDREQVEEAKGQLEQARAAGLGAKIEDARYPTCDATLRLGRLKWKTDSAAAAEPLFRDALAIGADAEDPDARELAADAAVALGRVLLEVGQTHDAAAAFERGRKLAASSEESSARISEATALLEHGKLLAAEGLKEAAIEKLETAIDLGQRSKTRGGTRQAAMAAFEFARFLEKWGRHGESQEAFALTQQLARGLGEDDEIGKVLSITAMAHLDQE